MAVDVGQAAIDSVVAEGQAFVIEAEQVQDRRVQVVDRQDVFDGFETEFVGRAVADSAFDASSGEEGGKAVGIVISALGTFLEHRHTAELGTPHNQRVVEQPSLPHVVNQCRGWLIHDAAVNVVLLSQLLMTVPVQASAAGVGPVEELHEANTFLDQSPREDAVFGVT